MSDFYKLSAKLSTGEQIEFSKLRGSVILIVNTASQCGFTPQYVGLQNMYEKHQHNNFKILAFPCNQFGAQEPNNNENILKFCEMKYRVTFPIMEKIFVNGENQHPVFKFLTNEKKGFLIKNIKWNFTKFLIDRKGIVRKRYPPTAAPSAIEKDLNKIFNFPPPDFENTF